MDHVLNVTLMNAIYKSHKLPILKTDISIVRMIENHYGLYCFPWIHFSVGTQNCVCYAWLLLFTFSHFIYLACSRNNKKVWFGTVMWQCTNCRNSMLLVLLLEIKWLNMIWKPNVVLATFHIVKCVICCSCKVYDSLFACSLSVPNFKGFINPRAHDYLISHTISFIKTITCLYG